VSNAVKRLFGKYPPINRLKLWLNLASSLFSFIKGVMDYDIDEIDGR
jgi:hypothetical protein